MNADEILELLRIKMDCSYVSDLPYLTGKQRTLMLCQVEQLLPNIINPREIQELYVYLRETV